MKTFKKMARQGDVLIMKAKGEKKLGEKVEDPKYPNKTVLAHGEVTGHHHRLEGPGPELFSIPETESALLKSDGMKALVHEEHDPFIIPKGDYEIVIQRQYAYGRSTRVAD